MLLKFKIRNFRSIKDEVSIDFIRSRKISKSDLVDNYTNIENISILNSLILSGRNASGKSNTIIALRVLRHLVVNSDTHKINEPILQYEPFLFDNTTKDEPVGFEIIFFAKNYIKYSFKIKYDRNNILFESLHFYPNKVRAKLFERIGSKISYGDHFKGDKKYLEDNLLNNQLILSKSSTSKYEFLEDAYKFFSKYLYIHTISQYENIRQSINLSSNLCLKSDFIKKNLKKIIEASDTNIIDFDIAENDSIEFKFPPNMPKELQEKIIADYKYNFKTEHYMFSEERVTGKAQLDISEESHGTQKLIGVGGLILDALGDGSVIVIDELDKSLHSLLTKLIIKLFHSKHNNPFNAQLIFTTHDSSLLDLEFMRRDQICFTDKEYNGATELYKLSDLTGIRREIPIDKWYLSGRFRAIPVTSEIKLEFDGVKTENIQ